MRTAITRKGSPELQELASYLEGIRSFSRLSRREEHALAVRAHEGEVAAMQKLVRHNLRFVVAIALKHRRGTIRLDDLVQEGNLGLLRAAEKFDPQVGTRFTSYAVWWIRAYIGKYLREARSTVRPHSGSVAYNDLSLDGAIDEEDDTTHLDRIEDGGPGPEDLCRLAEGNRAVRDALARARKRIGELGWDIVLNRLEQDTPRTLDSIGKRWGLSRERVRQRELRTKQFLRGCLQPVVCDAA